MHTNTEKLLNTKEAANLLGLSYQTLEKWRSLGIGPSFLKLGNKAVRYRAEVLLDFIERGTVIQSEVATLHATRHRAPARPQ